MSPRVSARREGRTRTAEAGSASRVADPGWIRRFQASARQSQRLGGAGARRRRRPLRGERRQFQLGCDPRTRVPDRVGHEAVHGVARRAAARPRRDARASGRPTSGSGTCSRTSAGYDGEIGDLAPLRRRRRRARRRWSPSCRRSSGSSRSSRRGRTRTRATGSRAGSAAQQNGSTYEDALQEHVLRRRPASEATFGRRARGHRARAERRRRLSARPAPVGRARLDRRGPRPLRPTGSCAHAADARAAGRRTAKPPGGVYGLGLFGERVGGDEVWGHPGSYGGFQSPLLLVPSRDAWLRRADEQQPRQPGAVRRSRTPSSSELLGARRRGRTDGRARAGGARTASAAPTRTATAGRRRSTTGRRGLVAADATTLEATARPIGPTTFEIVGGDCRPRPVRLPARRFRPLRQPARRARPVIAAVAAGHPATAEAGAEILADGRHRRRRRRRGVARVVCRGDRDDGPARRRARDLPRRGDR